ncbi:MAG: anaerobic carbon-monoxide dehydrogenase catalytic subunit [Dehalococcoidia bacterium]|nr:anaerobic carbon-monoxide dehydrogenase catalytic subunit [Dehalococcoidia bacterium]
MPDGKSIDPATLEVLEIAESECISTAFSRAEEIQPCPTGASGRCCKNCFMGPCRFIGETTHGVCGASLTTIAARNLARSIAAGTSAHSDHGRDMAFTLLAAAKGQAPGYEIKDVAKLHAVAGLMGVEVGSRSKEEIAIDVANKAIAEFGKQNDNLIYLSRAPQKRQEIWKKLGIAPRGVDREVVEMLHRTVMGNDQDPEHILLGALRTSLADGWGGSMLSTDISDILFGTPAPVRSQANLGVLKEDEVNVVIHGHEPTLSMLLVQAASDPEMIAYAKTKGAKGINLAGICCTANEILTRQGISVAGNFLQQELAIITGAVEAMVVDVQCVMEALVPLSARYHTKLITTSRKAKIEGALHIQFDEHDAVNIAKKIIRTAVDNYPNRGRVRIPDVTNQMIAGFSHEYIAYMQGGIYRQSFRPLNDAIIAGRIRGAAGVVGCNNPRVGHDEAHIGIIRELIKNDVLVVTTGCGALSAGKFGLLTPEMMDLAGPGLKEVCNTIGIPPVLHMGSCVDNSRILTVLTQMATEGGLGDDISDLPGVGIAPEWMSEKALAIGAYFVASGAYVLFGVESPFSEVPELTKLVGEGWEKLTGGKLEFEPDWLKIVDKSIAHIDAKRKALKLPDYDPEKFAKSKTYLPGDALTPEVYAAGKRSLAGVDA